MTAEAASPRDVDASEPGSRLYIASPAFDWAFILGSPLLGVAAVLLAARFLPASDVEYYVLGYLAVGHHVPTFLRAYGDPDEFARNRVQLVLVPLCIVPLVVWLAFLDAQLLTLIFVWDQYHFVRQHYGFMRIYDVKAGASSPFDAQLDQVLCATSFLAILGASSFYGYMYADSLYRFGIVTPDWLARGFGEGAAVAAIATAVVYLGRLGWRVSHGMPVAWLKIVLFSTTFGVWYFAYVTLADGFLSYAISSFFHCLQYDAFAWYYNREKASSLPPTAGNAFFRRVHARGNLWLYVALIGTYGLASSLGREVSIATVLVLNTSTGLLHYYFDSFIWRVRRADFRKHLK